MDKETLSQYGWVVIVILILVIMIALASPFGNFVADNFSSAYTSFGNITDDAFISAGLGNFLQEPPATFKTGIRYRFLDGSNSTFEFKDAVGDMDTAIVLHYPGFDDFEVPKLCVTNITDTSFTLATLGMYPDYDGTYTIYPDGFVEKDGTIVAKSEEKWVDLNPGEYLITCGNDIYYSEDGNTPINLVYAYSDMIDAYSALIELEEYYPDFPNLKYKFDSNRIPDGSITLHNVYDLMAMQTIQFRGEGVYTFVSGIYNYFGGFGSDSISNNDYIQTANWDSDITRIRRMAAYKVINNDTAVKVKLSDTLCGIYKFTDTETYYYKGTPATNILFIIDYPFAYTPGMTAEEWFYSEFTGFYHDDIFSVDLITVDDFQGEYLITLLDAYRNVPIEEAFVGLYYGTQLGEGVPPSDVAVYA